MKIANAIGRSVEEWIGKTPDQKVPDRVRLRVFNRHEGRCYLTDKKIRTGERWEIEHIVALANGGEHRESNMAPALVAPHKDKTRADRREQTRIAKLRKSHIGLRKSRHLIPGSKGSGWRKPMHGPAYRVSE